MVMNIKLNDAENLADKILNRMNLFMNERKFLRHELSSKSDGNMEHTKDFVKAFQENVISNDTATEKIAKLEHILLLRS